MLYFSIKTFFGIMFYCCRNRFTGWRAAEPAGVSFRQIQVVLGVVKENGEGKLVYLALPIDRHGFVLRRMPAPILGSARKSSIFIFSARERTNFSRRNVHSHESRDSPGTMAVGSVTGIR